MAFGSLEIASIPRTQDYSVMKQNEDNKGAFQQMTLGQQSQKQSEKLTKEVHSSDNADWYTGQYAGNGGDKRRKKKEPEDGVVIQKQHRGFDIKI